MKAGYVCIPACRYRLGHEARCGNSRRINLTVSDFTHDMRVLGE